MYNSLMVFLMKLKNMIYSTVMLVVGVFSSCSQRESMDEIVGGTGAEAVRIKIQVSPGMLATRTPVIGPDEDDVDRDGMQHVTYVQLLVFKQEENFYNLVYNAPVNWSENIPKDINLGRNEAVGYHPISEDLFEPGVQYCLVAIGLDASKGYEGTPEESSLTIPPALAGNSVDAYLSSIELLLSDHFSIVNDKIVFPGISGNFPVEDENCEINPIARSEFFAGCTYVTGQKNMPEITVRAERRVAGVKAYLKGIPQQIDDTKVTYIAIGTGPNEDFPTRYNVAIPLLPIDSDGAEYKDYIPNDEDNIYEEGMFPIIAPLPENMETFQSRAIGGGGPDDDEPENYPDEDLIKVNEGVVTLMGYLPPVVFSPDETRSNSTMMLYLLDKDYNVLSSKKIVHLSKSEIASSRAGTGIIDRPITYPYDSRYHYPIMANHFYRIGTPDNPVDLDASEAEIVVSIDEFQDEYYGGHLGDNEGEGVNMDTSWGNHNAGNLEGKSK